MFALPHTSTVKGKFNWYDWSACVYETDQEIIDAIQKNACFGKTLRGIKVIGETRLSQTSQSHFTNTKGETYVDGIHAIDPIVFEFSDGSTLELLPQQASLIRIGFDMIPHDVTDGIRPHNGMFEHFFKTFSKLFIGKRLISIEVQTTKHEESIVSFKYPETQTTDREEDETKIFRFIFEGGFTISLKQRRWNDYCIRVYFRNSVNASKPFAYPEVVKLDESFNACAPLSSGKGWFYDNWGGYMYIYPTIDDPQTPLDDFLVREAQICCDEDVSIELLEEFWQKYLDEDEEFEHWGFNLYDYDSMKTMINDIQSFVERVDRQSMNADDKAMLENLTIFGARWIPHQNENGTIEQINISPTPMEIFLKHRDLMLQFCEYVSAMMRSCPNAQYICIQGP